MATGPADVAGIMAAASTLPMLPAMQLPGMLLDASAMAAYSLAASTAGVGQPGQPLPSLLPGMPPLSAYPGMMTQVSSEEGLSSSLGCCMKGGSA